MAESWRRPQADPRVVARWWRRRLPRMDRVAMATAECGGGNGRGPRWRWPRVDPAAGK
uniref:Uncharacterized protein n=1 Tax=Oryza sativa subsp. japonica TaxID=39947 RepID=Q69VD6_ORYSJ|nr:hypothetical protein [Oryza sativa Japonica Group]